MTESEIHNTTSPSELPQGERTIVEDAELGQEAKIPPAHAEDDNFEDDTAPDGGLEAWLVAAGGFCIFFCCLGVSNSFGILAEYYLAHQLLGKSANDVAWIGSLSAFLQFFAGMVGGPLFDRFGAQVCLMGRRVRMYLRMLRTSRSFVLQLSFTS